MCFVLILLNILLLSILLLLLLMHLAVFLKETPRLVQFCFVIFLCFAVIFADATQVAWFAKEIINIKL